MPKSTPMGFIIGIAAGVFAFTPIWEMWIPMAASLLAVIGLVIVKSFNTDTDYYVPADEVRAIEEAHIKEANS